MEKSGKGMNENMCALTKIMKYELRYLDGFPDFSAMQKAVWQLQRETREILNRTIQEAYHWDYYSKAKFRETGEHPDLKKETGYKWLDGYIYHVLSPDYPNFSGRGVNATIQKAWKKYKSSKADVWKGTMSIPSYKSDQPVVMHASQIRLSGDNRAASVALSLFSREFNKENDLPGRVTFHVKLNDNTQRSIYQKLINKEYKLSESQLVYDKRKWFLYLAYSFEPEQHALDPDKILGVDMGINYAIYASSFGEYGSFRIAGNEAIETIQTIERTTKMWPDADETSSVEAYAAKLENRRRSLQQQARYCGEGRIGHGTKTRVDAVYQAENRIANFRSTINHRYSKALIEYAVKNGYGTIQMENLTGIKENLQFPRRLQHWTYYDLQAKIEAKAKEHGIAVVKVDPAYTSQRCSKCGHIDADNRPKQEVFCCTECGYACNADFNASQNLSIKDIDKIIKEKTKCEP